MDPKQRTKTIEQCEAEAALLCMRYGDKAHVFIKEVEVMRGLSYKREMYCAEKLELLTTRDVEKRILQYEGVYDENFRPYSTDIVSYASPWLAEKLERERNASDQKNKDV